MFPLTRRTTVLEREIEILVRVRGWGVASKGRRRARLCPERMARLNTGPP